MPGRLLLNLYGCSEASGDSVSCELSAMKTLAAAPVGRPIANTQIYILDRHLQPVPIGVAGELYIGGEGVGRGYHNRPELTAARFLPDPFSTQAGATLYRTGDLARFLPDGNIDYIGRMDFQVKVRGQRIELGEIEHALSGHPAVRHAIVDARDDEQGQKRLIAYVVPYKKARIDVKELRARLAAALPPGMVPAGFVVLAEMPLTPNGKVSRRDLPDPVRTRASSQQALVPPRDQVEARVAAVWSQALGLDLVGATDDFFEVGGDSLKAVRVLAAIGQEFGTELSLSRFLQAPTVEHTADMLRFSAAPETESLLLPVRTEGSRPPIFCVHPNTTDIGRFDALADRLGPEQPLYGIRAPDSETDQEELFLSELASRCADEVRRVQPRGPYLLAGYCSGGRLAFEIAVRLSEDAEAVPFLALLEAFGPGHVRPPVISLVRAHLRKLREMPSSERLPFLARKARNASNRALQASALPWKAFVSGRRNGHARGPESVATFPGRATLFRSQLAYRDYEDTDRTLGWSGSVAGGIEVVEVAGGHEEILKEPFVAGLADQLAARLTSIVNRRS
jgi:aspartate racemase